MKISVTKPIFIGILFLTVQVASVIYARFIPERFFCWAPYDEHTYYSIDVVVDGRSLTLDEVKSRYRYLPEGWEPRCIDNVFSLVQQYESTYGKAQDAEVTITYSTNGKTEKIWRPKK